MSHWCDASYHKTRNPQPSRVRLAHLPATHGRHGHVESHSVDLHGCRAWRGAIPRWMLCEQWHYHAGSGLDTTNRGGWTIGVGTREGVGWEPMWGSSKHHEGTATIRCFTMFYLFAEEIRHIGIIGWFTVSNFTFVGLFALDFPGLHKQNSWKLRVFTHPFCYNMVFWK